MQAAASALRSRLSRESLGRRIEFTAFTWLLNGFQVVFYWFFTMFSLMKPARSSSCRCGLGA